MAIVKDKGNPQSMVESHLDRNPDAPIKRRVQMTIGVTYPKGRSVICNATVAGNAVFQYPDGSTATVPVQVGYQGFPDSITSVVSATATGVFFNEY